MTAPNEATTKTNPEPDSSPPVSQDDSSLLLKRQNPLMANNDHLAVNNNSLADPRRTYETTSALVKRHTRLGAPEKSYT